jgi:murein DD-endopeptidase MepM/ murein hydrolase activator NlpD
VSRTARLAPLLIALLATGSTGCGVFAGAKPTPTPTSTPTHTPTSTPTATATPQPQLETPDLQVAQGGAVVLRVRAAAASAVAEAAGKRYELLATGGGFWGVIAAAADAEPGAFELTVTLSDRTGLPAGMLHGTLSVLDTAFPVEEIYLAPEESALLDPSLAAQEEATRTAVYGVVSRERLWSGPFIYPSAAEISSPFGIGRSYNGAPVSSYHHGTDFAADQGEPVVAANSGRVAYVGSLPIRGTSVIIDHGAGVFSAYHHLTASTVAEGQMVAKGDLIAYSGGTGLATGPHLHWEIIVGGIEVDPVLWTYDEIGP